MGLSRYSGFAPRALRFVLVALMLTVLIVPASPALAIPPSISGTVTDDVTGAALEGVWVELWDVNDEMAEEPVAVDETDSSGYYSFGSIPNSDSYVLYFSRFGYGFGEIWDFPYTGTALVKNISLVPLAKIVEGTVTKAGGPVALEGAMVDASKFFSDEYEDYYEWAGSGWSDSGGTYLIWDEYSYGSGDYQFAATHPAYFSASEYQTWDGETALDQDFALEPAVQIASGFVTDDASGDPIVGESVEAAQWNDIDEWFDWTGSGTTGDDGYYEVYDTNAYGAGEYELAISAWGYRRAVAYRDWDGATGLDQDFALVPPVAIAEGFVTQLGSGDPIEGAYVEASKWDDVNMWYDWTGSADSGTDGSYEVFDENALGSGEYDLAVSAWGFLSDSRAVTWDGATELTESFELEQAPAIASGIVTDDATGDPLVGAYIDAAWYNDVEGWWEYAGSADTDVDGAYTVRDESDWGAGDVQVSAYYDGYNSATAEDTWDGSTVLEIDFALSNEVVPVRVDGVDRFKTAVEASRLAFPEDGMCETAIIASGRNFPDALGGSALAGALYGPVLLTEPTALPESVADEIERLGASNVIIIGGTTAVSDTVKGAIDRLPGVSVERINGVNRYQTAAMVAERTVDELGPNYSGQVLVATGMNFPDALAGAPLAAASGTPIVLVQRDLVPEDTADVLDSISPETALILGGTSAVSAATQADLEGMAGDVIRLDGVDRYATAARVAQYGVDEFGLGWDRVAFATGANFPDALAGGAAQGLTGSVVLLTKSTTLEAAPKTKLEDNADQILEVRFFGGLTALTQAVRTAVVTTITDNKSF